MSDSPPREWRFYLDDMIGFVERVDLYTATCNQLIHGYLGIDNDTIWSSIKDDIPTLLPQLKALREAVTP